MPELNRPEIPCIKSNEEPQNLDFSLEGAVATTGVLGTLVPHAASANRVRSDTLVPEKILLELQ